jgi:hypothetical protein
MILRVERIDKDRRGIGFIIGLPGISIALWFIEIIYAKKGY